MNDGPIITINSRKFDQSIRRSWTARLIERRPQLLVFEGVFDRDVAHPDLGLISAGTISREFYWLDRWYNVFLFHEPAGEFRNYYCNINMPPSFSGTTLDYVDLDIDVVIWPDKRVEVLDIAEFEKNARLFEYPETVRTTARYTLDNLIELIEKGGLPT